MVFRSQCGCRPFATASAAQLKPKIQAQSAGTPRNKPSPSAKLPTAKSWVIPPASPKDTPLSGTRLPSSKNWNAPLETSAHAPAPPPRHIPSTNQGKPSSQSSSLMSMNKSAAPSQLSAKSPRIEHITAKTPPRTVTAKNWSQPPPRPTETLPNKIEMSSPSSSVPAAKNWSKPLPPTEIKKTETSYPSSPAPTAKNWSQPRPAVTKEAERPPAVKDWSQPSHSAERFNRVATPPLTPRPVESTRNQAMIPSRQPPPHWNKNTIESSPVDRRQQRNNVQSAPVRSPSRNIPRQHALPPANVLKSQMRQRKRVQRRKNVFIPSTLTVAQLASILGVKLAFLQRTMKRVGMTEETNYDYILTSDYAVLLAEELNFNPLVDDEAAFDILPPPPHPNPSSLPSRPPVVTIMGHVDHGKTTLLDTLRSASVAKGEAGGITQHIGAFSVPVKLNQSSSSNEGPQTITFLDTPGHAAFSAMRARGADVTDIIVLVVAADDGIMPQTKEVINLLKKEDSEISLVVAINKIDKPGADPEAVKLALMAEGIQLEDFGGDIPAVHVSGLTGEGLPELVETLSMVAEMQDLRAEHDGPVYGHVLESNFHKGLGPVATVLIARGCLKPGTQLISGVSHGKVRLMKDSTGAAIKAALPGMAVIVSGWKNLPKAGDEVLDGTESDIKKALANREKKLEDEAKHQDIDAINAARRIERDVRATEEREAAAEAARFPNSRPIHTRTPTRDIPTENSGPKELKLIIKSDVSGSGEALKGALDAMGNNVAVSKVISTAVGDITESDVTLAKAANATLVGFSVSVPRSIRNLAVQNAVPIFISDIIYRLVDDVRAGLIEMLPKIVETKVVGEANVSQIFDIHIKGGKIMKVAGCRIINGIVDMSKPARVIRGGETVHQGMLDTMRQLKKDITEARKGLECGLSFKDFTELREGDLIQTIETIEKPGIL